MESANLNLHHHQHQLQEQLIGSSSLATPSFYGVGATRSWNSNLSLTDGDFNQNISGVLSNPRDSRQNISSLDPPDLNASMIQELGFNWASTAGSFTNYSAHHLQQAKIKEELSDSLSKFSDTVNNPSNIEEFHLPSTRYIKDEQQDFHELGGKILFKTYSSGCQSIGPHFSSAGDLYSNAPSCGSFGGIATSTGGNLSQIFPTRNMSELNPLPLMNFQALDLLSSSKFGGSISQLSPNNIGLSKERFSCSPDHLQESCHKSPNYPNKISSFTNGVAETKRASNFEAKSSSHGVNNKKGRFESRSSFPPFKVRKEKLGDRIAALQQLVAPFGKTDTASVLMEAIGYIKFLQEQTLSLPYLKSSRNKTCRTLHGGSSEEDRNEEQQRDLRSRGLCLVPLSCTSYVTNDIGGVWPPPNFN
ncbi:transcription factor bHLH110 isoform X2 [Macadamia integrifolia]|uniref:transcription factor bHLH110 isoform X2 n=1 Tax=Macadamia integrifolia TaxID=60698 RepID=UPI001C4F71E8|nr:transcription factor bHLH110 isoform X2 [Macadamia integrifolia]